MIVALTLPIVTEINEEIKSLETMLSAGLSRVHLRKPGISLEIASGWLRNFSGKYEEQIVWHLPYAILQSDPSLLMEGLNRMPAGMSIKAVADRIESFALNNHIRHIHLPAWFRKKAMDVDVNWHQKLPHGLAYSTSIHHLKELMPLSEGFKEDGQRLDYVLVSPVFDSLSKSAYKASTDLLRQVKAYKNTQRAGPIKLLALGGICAGNIGQLGAYGFDGAVLNGCIWYPDLSSEKSLHNFKICYKKWKQH